MLVKDSDIPAYSIGLYISFGLCSVCTYLFKQSHESQNHLFSRFERMKIFNLIGLLMQVGADQCYFYFKNNSPDPIRIALRPQLHVRITTKKEFAVTPRSHHLGTFCLRIRVESQFLVESGIHEPPA